MAVDLSAGRHGIITFKNGDKYFCISVNGSGDQYVVRIESGEYWTYTKDGNYWPHKVQDGESDARVIVDFLPCERDDPRAAGLNSQACP